jgi:hypothetical protein
MCQQMPRIQGFSQPAKQEPTRRDLSSLLSNKRGLKQWLTVSADTFIAAALEAFGDPDPQAGSPWDRGARLAGLVGTSRSLLVLDGLEPLQHPPGPLAGQLAGPEWKTNVRDADKPYGHAFQVIGAWETPAEILSQSLGTTVFRHTEDDVGKRAPKPVVTSQWLP